MSEEKIKAVLILEILGKPAEHIKKVLGEIVDNLGKESKITLISKKIADVKELPEQKGIFTTFAEVEIESCLDKLMMIIFGYMPSHIEIIYPEDLKINNADLNLFFNELARKLHQYDELAKTMLIEREIIAKQIQEGKIKVEEKKRKGKKKRN